MNKFPTQMSIGDRVYNPLYGKGVVTKIFDHEALHIQYASYVIIHLARDGDSEQIRRTKTHWEMRDPILGDHQVAGYIEILEYNLATRRTVSFTKPYHLTPTGRLRFSCTGMPIKHGISSSSLNIVQQPDPYILRLYTIKGDPKGHFFKARWWREVARKLGAMS